jgi:hypothetical protein
VSNWSCLTDDNSFAGQLFYQIHLVAGRAFNEVDVGQFVTDIDKCRCRGVEKAAVGNTRQRETTGGSEHYAGGWCADVARCRRDGDVGKRCFAGALRGKERPITIHATGMVAGGHSARDTASATRP